MKLLTLFCLAYHLPIVFSRQPGNIPDVISVLNALKQLSVLGMDKPLLVLDGGLSSEENILSFIHAHTKFLMRSQLDGKWILAALEQAAAEIAKPSNACPDDLGVYCIAKRMNHVFSFECKYMRGVIQKGEMATEEHRLYLYVTLDTDKARLDITILMDNIPSGRRKNFSIG